ncbi:hypothetical protein OEZ85_005786 [Tetradesmus obliquus]|uniref:EF-hand domain-containing protein n=1 Tax=Tetradesmus obliquus TaxID=3088 RepID=A0ABY8UEF8_TETOB|nr:hypothetical protein OEZ85_005786 [Tetradesmus obliquus]
MQQEKAHGSCAADDSCSEDEENYLIGTQVADGGSAECYQLFEDGMVAQGLSQLSKTAAGTHPAFLRLDITGTTLSNPAAITHCSHLQHVNLGNNCLTTLQGLGALQQLTVLDASRNQLTQVLEISTSSSDSGSNSSSNLRSADLSYNQIRYIRDLSEFRRLSRLVLDGNQIEHIGSGLRQLHCLQHLSLSGNKLSSCQGLEGLTSLRELALDGNRLTSLAPLAALSGLEVLLAAHNHLSSCEGVQGLVSLRRLDVSGNALRRLEALRPACGLQLLGELDLAANPLEAAQNVRLHTVYLLPQVSLLNGSAVSSEEKVDAANMAGAAAEGLLAIRQHYFVAGELDDGGGAVPPTAAGLTPSRAEEECSCRDADVMFEAIDAWASKDEPWAQLQLARACYSWVVSHVQLPRGCDVESGADVHTWDVGLLFFGEEEEQQLLHQALLPGHSGTLAECVSQLLVQLVLACHMEAVQLSGYWKAGGAGSVQPGERLAAHNHSWVAVKVNGRWRLLDPVYAILKQGQLPFYLPPEAFIHSHLPFEAYWQLLPDPISLEAWWALPEVSLALCAAGGRLVDGGQLRACNVLPAVREGQVLPSLKIPLAGPCSEQQYLCVKLLDNKKQMLASWQHKPSSSSSCSSRGSSRSGRCTIRQLSQQQQQQQIKQAQAQAEQYLPNNQQQQQCQQQQQQQQQQQCLVYQQHVGPQDGSQRVAVGHQQRQVALQELWVAPPAPGTYFVHVELVQKTPGWLQLSVAGLQKPLQLTYWQQEDVMRVKVVVPPVQPHDPADGICVDPATPAASLPQPQRGFAAFGDFQLRSPWPGQVLEADRAELFEVVVPGAAAVAVGCEELGWQELAPAAGTAAAVLGDAARDPAEMQGESTAEQGRSSNSSREGRVQPGLFRGTVVLPRREKCYVAARSAGAGVQQGNSSWMPIVSLQVVPQVQHLVAVPVPPAALPEGEASEASLGRLRKLLTALDVNGDGVVSRRDMLLAFRRDRQLADHLKMPPRIKAGDGSFDKFLSRFIAINSDGLGYVDLVQLGLLLSKEPLAGAPASQEG